MNHKHPGLILAAMLAASFTAVAQEVYENVDKQGVVEFTDQPGPGAKPVDVQPNVVDVAPVKPLAPSSPAPARAAGAARAPAGGAPPEVQREDVVGDAYGDYDNRREQVRERARVEHRENAGQVPAHRVPARAPSAPAGVHVR